MGSVKLIKALSFKPKWLAKRVSPPFNDWRKMSAELTACTKNCCQIASVINQRLWLTPTTSKKKHSATHCLQFICHCKLIRCQSLPPLSFGLSQLLDICQTPVWTTQMITPLIPQALAPRRSSLANPQRRTCDHGHSLASGGEKYNRARENGRRLSYKRAQYGNDKQVYRLTLRHPKRRKAFTKTLIIQNRKGPWYLGPNCPTIT